MTDDVHRRIDTAPGLTPFMRAVYHVVAVIPKGSVMTYAQVARAIGKPLAVRAVGTALNRNPLAPDVPCHRVVRSDGTVGGFASGTEKKKALLVREGALD
jgi:methylated-DNA-[protein]-cysteine S-methyltransferase